LLDVSPAPIRGVAAPVGVAASCVVWANPVPAKRHVKAVNAVPETSKVLSDVIV
jgi:hypothetical protein